MRIAINFVLITVAVASFGALFFAPEYFAPYRIGGLPVLNAITPLGLCTAAAAAIRLSPGGSVLQALSVAALVAAILWLPLSIGLAGNLRLNFSGTQGDRWIWMNLFTFPIVLITFAWALLRVAVVHIISRNEQS